MESTQFLHNLKAYTCIRKIIMVNSFLISFGPIFKQIDNPLTRIKLHEPMPKIL